MNLVREEVSKIICYKAALLCTLNDDYVIDSLHFLHGQNESYSCHQDDDDH